VALHTGLIIHTEKKTENIKDNKYEPCTAYL
jgi:hypothetical protein